MCGRGLFLVVACFPRFARGIEYEGPANGREVGLVAGVGTGRGGLVVGGTRVVVPFQCGAAGGEHGWACIGYLDGYLARYMADRGRQRGGAIQELVLDIDKVQDIHGQTRTEAT